MSWQAAFGYSLMIGVPVYLLGIVLRGFFPRKAPIDPFAEPHGWEKRS